MKSFNNITNDLYRVLFSFVKIKVSTVGYRRVFNDRSI